MLERTHPLVVLVHLLARPPPARIALAALVGLRDGGTHRARGLLEVADVRRPVMVAGRIVIERVG
ncbi:hypothetical protein EEJ31_00235 [Cryobacterium tepidiphilum]|uniref:Uncharacterized protein n=1 Tax=Cryobacterium tepidiphilum TaxID=2486026 RepID=A0A3M8LPF2_9MICO|nr:hypothetical protein EEJ31_00235 [Cryobacterium tepidiphilum]